MAKLKSEQRLVNSVSHRKNNSKKEVEFVNDEQEFDNIKEDDTLLEQVSELYGKEYDFSKLTKNELEEFYNYALQVYKNGDFSLLQIDKLPLDLNIKINSLPVVDIKENINEKSIKNKNEKIKKSYDWNNNFIKPTMKYDDKNVIIEADINMCSESAKQFIEKLFASYVKLAENNKIKVRDIEISDKKFSFLFEGENAFKIFKYEKGLHYIKEKEYNSNVFISTIPQMNDEDYEIKINPNDLKIDTYRSGGAGGQHVNKTSSAVRITHIPTGTVVVCQNERSQLMNKNMAMKLLATKLNEKMISEKENNYTNIRLESFDTTKIRTYDLNNNILIDHRIGYKTGIEQGIEKFNLNKIINKLEEAERENIDIDR